MRQRVDLLTPMLAATATWVAAWTWTPFAESPGQFLGPLVISCLIVAVAGALLRGAGLPWYAVLICQALLLVVWINHHLAAAESSLDWIPTRHSLEAVGTALEHATDIAQHEPSPVDSGLAAFAAFPFAIATGCALLVDVLACGLRFTPLAGLPLLAMYTAPVSQLDDSVPLAKFALGALLFVAVLWAAGAHRFRLPLLQTPGALGSGIGSALAIGVPAVVVAALMAGVIPTLSRNHFGGSGSGNGTGGDSVRLNDPSLNMKRDLLRGADVPLVRAITSSDNASYLRTSVLDLFDDGIWKPGTRQLPTSQRAHGLLPAPVGLDQSVVATQSSQWYFATAPQFHTTWLPLPFPATAANARGDWRYDASTMDVVRFKRTPDDGVLQWTATGLDPDIDPTTLADAGAPSSDIVTRYAETKGIPSWIGDLADQVTADGDSDFERAVLLQRWFTRPHDNPDDPDFAYSLDTAADGSSLEAVTDFLRNTRTGYCEQFAGAMTMMARTLGIPARIAVGFLNPSRATQAEKLSLWGSTLGRDTHLTAWTYSSHDLHAWPELYFEGVGWVRFEPTPSGRLGAHEPGYTSGIDVTGDDSAAPDTPLASASVAPSPQAPAATQSAAPTPDTETTSGGGGSTWPLVVVIVVIVILVAASIVPRLARRGVRRRRWARAEAAAPAGGQPMTQAAALAAAEAAWAELRDGLVDLGFAFDRHTTVRRAAAAIELHDYAAKPALDRIVAAVERARYAAPDLAGSPTALRWDVELCLTAAEAAMVNAGTDTGLSRLWHRWVPRSLLTPAGWQIDDRLPAEATLVS